MSHPVDPVGAPVLPSRRLCVGLLVVSGVAFVALAAWLVPWHWVPGGHYRHVAPSAVFSPAQIARADAFTWPQRIISWSSLVVSLVVSLVLGFTRVGRALLGRLRGPWWWRIVLATILVLAVGELVTLPFGWAAHVGQEHYGLTRQPAAGWWQDQATSYAVSVVPTALALLVVAAIARRAPRTWPLWAGLAAATLAVAGSFVYPVVVEPLFNSFTPLRAGPLRTEILALARTEHVHVTDVLVADASRRTTTLNAYVSGFGSTRRVVLYDTLLTELPRREIAVIVAHELGHARHDDVATGTALGAVGSVFGVALLGLVLGAPGVRRRAGADGPGDPRAVAAVLALAAVGTLLVSPLQNTISRDVEARADRASLAATHDYTGFVAMQKKLALSALQSPTPIPVLQWWFGTHPTTLQRIGIAEALRR